MPIAEEYEMQPEREIEPGQVDEGKKSGLKYTSDICV